MSLKEKTIDEIIEIEGGYVNDPDDSGGPTKYGITERRARASGYEGDIEDLPREFAFDIYCSEYWDVVRGDDLVRLSEAVAEEVVDTSVNVGPGRAARYLQRCLNALNNRAKLYPDLIVDGKLGPNTVSTLRGYLANRDEHTLVKALNCLQGAAYIRLTERREKDEKFLYGWLRNRVVI